MGQSSPSLCRPLRRDGQGDTFEESFPGISPVNEDGIDFEGRRQYSLFQPFCNGCFSSRFDGDLDAGDRHFPVVQQCCLTAGQEERNQQGNLVSYQGGELIFHCRRQHWLLGSEPLSRCRLLVPFTQHRFKDYYDTGKKLGEGSFGDVFEAFLRPVDPVSGLVVEEGDEMDVAETGSIRQDGFKVAVKIFLLANGEQKAEAGSCVSGVMEDMKRRSSFETERQMLASLEHPNIVRMYECFAEASGLYIVLEHCSGGEVYTRLVEKCRQNGGGGFDESVARVLFRQMLQAVAYLHARRIVHRDIKTENFLLMGPAGTPKAHVLKLCDFGTAVVLTDRHPRSMEKIGTLSYTAPEVYLQRGAACAADCWSLGVVLYVILTSANPFRSAGNTSREETIRRIQLGHFDRKRSAWGRISELGQGLIQQMLVLEEDQRLTCTEALQCSWFVYEDRCADKRPIKAEALAVSAEKLLLQLQRLPIMSEAQRLALGACAVAITEADFAHASSFWRDTFLSLDQENEGCLSIDAAIRGVQQIMGDFPPVQPEVLRRCVQALDLDHSGEIEWVEFLALALLGMEDIEQIIGPLSRARRLLDRPDTCVFPLLHVAQANEKSSRWSPPGDDQVMVLDETVATRKNGVVKPVQPCKMSLDELRNLLLAKDVSLAHDGIVVDL